MTNLKLYGIIFRTMSERQPKSSREVSFGETMNPNTRSISDDGRYVGILLLHGEEIIVEWPVKNGSSVRTSLHLLKAVVREGERIVKERGEKK